MRFSVCFSLPRLGPLSDQVRALARIFLTALFLIAALAGPALAAPSETPAKAAAKTAAAAEPKTSEIQKAIALLEDEQRRQELIKLLKLMAALEDESKPAAAEAAAPEEPAPVGVKGYLQATTEEAWRDLTSFGAGLRQSWRETQSVFTALATRAAADVWRPYLLKICAWGLACLLATWVIIRRYGKLPKAEQAHGRFRRLKILARYVLVVAGPNLLLILSILAVPRLSTTAPGVTADLAIGFSFLHALIQYFFVSLSVVYILLQMAAALFTPGEDGHCLVNIHPVLARHFLRSWRVFVIYNAAFIFIDETLLSHFAFGSFYTVTLIALTIPIPVYLTFRVLKLKRLVHLVNEAEASAGAFEDTGDALANSEEEEPGPVEPPKPPLDYRADLWFRRHWASLLIVCTWVLTLISLINPIDASERFMGRLLVTLVMIGLALLAVRISRRLLRRLVDRETEHGRRLLMNVDNLANIVIWGLLTVGVLTTWGFPLGRVLHNEVTRDLMGRAFAIAVTIAALGVFIRFSRLATEWLLSVPNLGQNRNWRTMAPLMLTVVRSLAVFVGVVVVLERLGVNVGPILAGAGILGLGVGMGAQSLVKDVINGISILLADTLAVGDYVTISGKSGTVDALGLRTIRLRDAAGNLTVVPNSSVDTIVNMTRDYSQDLVEFIAPYDADPDWMLKLAAEVAQDLSQDPLWRRQLTSPVVVMGITAFDANGTTIRLKINTVPGSQWSVGRELRLRLKRQMLQDGLKSPWFGQNITVFQGDKPRPTVSSPAAGADAEPGADDHDESENQ